MSFDFLIDHTRQRFPHFHDAAFEVRPLEKGGSARRYYRIRLGINASLILVKYQPEAPENARFVAIANFLDGIGVNAPLIYFHDAEEGLIWMQDLGEEDLWNHRDESWSIRRGLYRRSLEQAARLHHTHPASLRGADGLPPFDASLYRWEQDYGLEQCFRRCFGVSDRLIKEVFLHRQLISLADELAALPRVLVHRDFQSQNILICDEEAYLIDFQGMRPGLAGYDVASLIYDPYVVLVEPERTDLMEHYRVVAELPISQDEWVDLVSRCAIQRLLQALGAYGFIARHRGKPEFLRHIAPAISNLRTVASRLSAFSFLGAFLDSLPTKLQPAPLDP